MENINNFYENMDKICAKEASTFRLPLEDLYPIYLFACMIHESYFVCVLPCHFHTKYYYIAAGLELLLWSQPGHFFLCWLQILSDQHRSQENTVLIKK